MYEVLNVQLNITITRIRYAIIMNNNNNNILVIQVELNC